MLLSVAMVVKNEINTLDRTIKSIRGYADEIVIGVDKGSDDGTRELANKLGDKVIDIYLSEELDKKESVTRDDDTWGFSKARNMVLDACKDANYRLTLDGHETVIDPQNVSDVIADAVEKGCDGVEVELLFEPDANGIPRQMIRQGRILAPTVRYNNPLHNVPIVKRLMFSKEFKIEHRKQDQAAESREDRDEQRSDSTINGLLKDIERDPKNTRSWFYLGNAYRGDERWQEAIGAYDHYLTISQCVEERMYARVNMGVCYDNVGNLASAREQYARALDEFPGMVEVYCSLGELACRQGMFVEAQLWLEACIEMPVPDRMLFVNPRAYLVDRYDRLSLVYGNLGRYGDAIEMAGKALESVRDSRIENNVKVWRKALGRK